MKRRLIYYCSRKVQRLCCMYDPNQCQNRMISFKKAFRTIIMFSVTRKKLRNLALFSAVLTLLFVFGVFDHPFEKDFYNDFHYPYDGNIEHLVNKLKHNITPHVTPINSYNFYYYKLASDKCQGVKDLRLVYIVKSAPQNYGKRTAIRSSWGFQRRFSDVEIRTVFLIGTRISAMLQKTVNEESHKYGDIIQANYADNYFNNTLKTMSGFQWVVKYCPDAKFYMFVDDDFYVSTKNVLRFVRNPLNYPTYLKQPAGNIHGLLQDRKPQVFDFELDNDVRLYSGYAFHSAPHRHLTSKWYVSLEEYPYHLWPPYVTAGAYILSRTALIDMYFASFYTKHFRFDDIYVALLAYKAKIEPLHCEEFYFYKKPYSKFGYQYVIASHGYDDPKQLVQIWNEQKSLGNA